MRPSGVIPVDEACRYLDVVLWDVVRDGDRANVRNVCQRGAQGLSLMRVRLTPSALIEARDPTMTICTRLRIRNLVSMSVVFDCLIPLNVKANEVRPRENSVDSVHAQARDNRACAVRPHEAPRLVSDG
jgi:hypothetical protein